MGGSEGGAGKVKDGKWVVLHLPQGHNNEQARSGPCLHGASSLVGKSITDEIELLQCSESCAEELCNVTKQVLGARQDYAQETSWTLRY